MKVCSLLEEKSRTGGLYIEIITKIIEISKDQPFLLFVNCVDKKLKFFILVFLIFFHFFKIFLYLEYFTP